MFVKNLLSKKNSPLPALSVKDFYNKRNKVLIYREARGIGDILMHRMLFEDFKKALPGVEITFACQKRYHEFLANHPYLDKIEDCDTVNKADYLITYDTTTCCIVHECMTYPVADKHRADIWAEHCGIKLTNHNMFLPFISSQDIENGKEKIKSLNKRNLPTVLFCPFAHDKLRTLLYYQIDDIIAFLSKNYFVYCTHTEEKDIPIPVLTGNTVEWLSYIHAADYVVTVDTSVFHYAGGIGKPLTGIFTHVDGKFRGQYYDFVLVQKHRDNGDWQCGPCYNYSRCSHEKCVSKDYFTPKPCLTELSSEEIIIGIKKMFQKWERQSLCFRNDRQ